MTNLKPKTKVEDTPHALQDKENAKNTLYRLTSILEIDIVYDDILVTKVKPKIKQVEVE